MNKQRKVLITTTYNEMGIIIDTKAEEVVQPDHNADVSRKADGDCISRQAVVKFFNDWISCLDENCHHQSVADMIIIKNDFKNLPSVQPDGIPLEWIDKHLEWLDNCDNDFAQLAKVSIKAMVELWKKDRI